MKQTRIIFYLLLALVVIAVLSVQKMKPTLKKITIENCFDTVSEITAYTSGEKPLIHCREYLNELHKELSLYDAESALSRNNRGETVEFSEDSKELIAFGDKFTRENPEAFSIYLYPLEKAWDIKNNKGVIPDVEAALAECKSEQQISLGAVAKGYATDRIAELLKEDGVSSALINLGGNTYALGKRPEGTGWKIGIQDPKDAENIIGIITAENLAVVTSGDYIRFFEKDGVHYHHIFDPQTGYPAKSGLLSVTVISENAALADALSTAIFVSGVKKGEELLKRYGAQGILITEDTIYFSKSLETIFKQEDFSYRYQFIY